MNFDFEEKETALRKGIIDLFTSDAKAALELLRNCDNAGIKNILSQWLHNLGELGYLELGQEQELNCVELVTSQETLAAISPSLFISVEVSTRIFGKLIATFGTPEQKTEILPALKQGRIMGTVALSEETMSVENNPFQTEGIARDNGYVVSGEKKHVINGPIADWIAVAGTIGDKVSFFLIRSGSEGLSIGKRISTLGYEETTISTLSLSNCPASKDRVIDHPDGGKILRAVRRWEDQVLTSASLGSMRRAFDTALGYAKTHESGGKPIIAYQEIGFKLAEMLTLLQTSQLLAYRAAWMDSAQGRERDTLVHCAKVFCTESAERIASDALQILGGRGYVRDNPAEEGYRDAKWLQIAGTSSEISRMKIADSILGSY